MSRVEAIICKLTAQQWIYLGCLCGSMYTVVACWPAFTIQPMLGVGLLLTAVGYAIGVVPDRKFGLLRRRWRDAVSHTCLLFGYGLVFAVVVWISATTPGFD
jgi:hypothetical protein